MTDADPADPTKRASLLRVKFEGGRFELNALPASTLVEVARLSKIFTALAEDIWRSHNRERQRVPAGFAKRFELCLAEIRPGSAVPVVVSREQLSEGMFEGDPTDLAEEAARSLEQAFIEIIRFNRLPAAFPIKAERDIVTVFSSLETNEYPIFENDSGERYNYTQHVRSNFIKSRSQAPQVSTGRIAGRLVELNTERRHAGLQLDDKRTVSVNFLPDVQEDMRASISVPNDERFVVIEGSYLIDAGSVVEVTNVDEVFPLSLPMTEGGLVLRELLSDDPSGEVEAIAPEAAEAAGEVLRHVHMRGLIEPAVFPSTDGGVQLVWRSGGFRRTVSIFDPSQLHGRTFQSQSKESSSREWHSIAALNDDLEGFLSGSN